VNDEANKPAGAQVLIVDDDADLRLSLKLVLDLAGYATRTASDGNDALRQQRELPAAILITDIFMPESDGFETIQKFRREFPQTRIVVISGAAKRAKQNYLSVAAQLGVDATIQKPFDVEELLATLRSLSNEAR
jgi:DNA-binding response OmpR family regulator